MFRLLKQFIKRCLLPMLYFKRNSRAIHYTWIKLRLGTDFRIRAIPIVSSIQTVTREIRRPISNRMHGGFLTRINVSLGSAFRAQVVQNTIHGHRLVYANLYLITLFIRDSMSNRMHRGFVAYTKVWSGTAFSKQVIQNTMNGHLFVYSTIQLRTVLLVHFISNCLLASVVD